MSVVLSLKLKLEAGWSNSLMSEASVHVLYESCVVNWFIAMHKTPDNWLKKKIILSYIWVCWILGAVFCTVVSSEINMNRLHSAKKASLFWNIYVNSCFVYCYNGYGESMDPNWPLLIIILHGYVSCLFVCLFVFLGSFDWVFSPGFLCSLLLASIFIILTAVNLWERVIYVHISISSPSQYSAWTFHCERGR